MPAIELGTTEDGAAVALLWKAIAAVTRDVIVDELIVGQRQVAMIEDGAAFGGVNLTFWRVAIIKQILCGGEKNF